MDIRLNTMGITEIHHVHPEGEWMVSLRGMGMHMDGNLDGTSSESTSDVLRAFPVAPTEMNMWMGMLHVMFAPADRLTLLAMVPYLSKEMDHRTRMGSSFTTRSSGLGDVSAHALFEAWSSESDRLIAEAGLTFPTGSIDEKDRTPMGEVVLPYPMQLGSGSVGFEPGLTWLHQQDVWSWGAHMAGSIPLYRNDEGYRLGSEATGSAWLARELAPWLSASLRYQYSYWGDISGADDRLNPALVPTAVPELRGGQRIDAILGLNLYQSRGFLAGHRLALEGGLPVYQSLHGPQLGMQYRWMAEWSFTY